MNKKQLSERDICTKYITPALENAGWDLTTQVREEFPLTRGRIIVRGKLHTRARHKRADYVLFYKPNIPIAVIEAKDNNHTVGDGMQQALGYADMLHVPFVFSSNGDGFLFHNRIAADVTDDGIVERELALHQFPDAETLWQWWTQYRGLDDKQNALVTQDYFSDGSDKTPRYYQLLAINKTIEAIARGRNRILLVMATGTGKTFTAFQIIWRLWKSRAKKRILFLADRNILVDQTMTNDFKPFGSAMTKIQKRQANKSYEIYLSLYQAVTGNEEEKNIYRQFSSDFFDLIIIDECHRGSAAADSAWREILEYFTSATQIGLTATPRETKEISNIDYFGDPIYTYSLRQGIDDGFLAPYKVVRIDLDRDLTGWRPDKGMIDKYGHEVEDRIYNQKDFDRTLVLEQRTRLVAQNSKYVMRITGDNEEGKAAVVLPDGFLFGEGTKTNLKRELLEEFNLHTIVRLPKGVFSPYTSIATNILFFEKGGPTEEVWFFTHPYPDGYKSYSRSKPLTIAEFDREKGWWGGAERTGRKTTEHAWKVSAGELAERNYNLDCKNPHEVEVNHRDPQELMVEYKGIVKQLDAAQQALKSELMACLGGKA